MRLSSLLKGLGLILLLVWSGAVTLLSVALFTDHYERWSLETSRKGKFEVVGVPRQTHVFLRPAPGETRYALDLLESPDGFFPTPEHPGWVRWKWASEPWVLASSLSFDLEAAAQAVASGQGRLRNPGGEGPGEFRVFDANGDGQPDALWQYPVDMIVAPTRHVAYLYTLEEGRPVPLLAVVGERGRLQPIPRPDGTFALATHGMLRRGRAYQWTGERFQLRPLPPGDPALRVAGLPFQARLVCLLLALPPAAGLLRLAWRRYLWRAARGSGASRRGLAWGFALLAVSAAGLVWLFPRVEDEMFEILVLLLFPVLAAGMAALLLGILFGARGARVTGLAALLLVLLAAPAARAGEAPPDLILHRGKIVTVDDRFSIRQALAVRDGRVLRVGSSREILKLRGPRTQVVDLQGRTVLPGLIDSHTHPSGAAMTEFDHPIPEMATVKDVLDYVRSRAAALKPGDWIQVRQVFITRLEEQRYPTREELDGAAPRNPVVFSTGPDASLNSLALKESGIDRDFRITDGGPGFFEKDPQTGEPTGILRSMTRYVKSRPSGRQPAEADQYDRVLQLFRDYNRTGLTTVADRDASLAAIARYRRMREKGELPVRLSISQHIDTLGPLEEIQANIRKVAADPLRQPDPMLRIVGIKTYLDGGMLTGSAYMREPWGVSKIYGITDPQYRGVLFIPRERLVPLVRTAVESGLQFTSHSVGDGAVHALLDAYEEVNKERPVRPTRPCITHSNFMSREAVEALPRLGVVADIQPDWLYLDTRTLVAQFGYDRLRYFQPLRSIFRAGGIAGGGSDHMQKIGSLRSINPYNPFLGMWIAVTRKAKGYDGRLHPEEALTREQAVRFYTRNNAYILFREHEVGSLEPGKLADLVVLDRDILTCPVDEIREIRPMATYLGGKPVFGK
jgi:predicted amidohydrolase YtcJ